MAAIYSPCDKRSLPEVDEKSWNPRLIASYSWDGTKEDGYKKSRISVPGHLHKVWKESKNKTWTPPSDWETQNEKLHSAPDLNRELHENYPMEPFIVALKQYHPDFILGKTPALLTDRHNLRLLLHYAVIWAGAPQQQIYPLSFSQIGMERIGDTLVLIREPEPERKNSSDIGNLFEANHICGMGNSRELHSYRAIVSTELKSSIQARQFIVRCEIDCWEDNKNKQDNDSLSSVFEKLSLDPNEQTEFHTPGGLHVVKENSKLHDISSLVEVKTSFFNISVKNQHQAKWGTSTWFQQFVAGVPTVFYSQKVHFSTQRCKFYDSGNCRKDNCTFLHAAPDSLKDVRGTYISAPVTLPSTEIKARSVVNDGLFWRKVLSIFADIVEWLFKVLPPRGLDPVKATLNISESEIEVKRDSDRRNAFPIEYYNEVQRQKK